MKWLKNLFKNTKPFFTPWIDDRIGSLILHYTTHGCMAQDQELTWVGIIEEISKTYRYPRGVCYRVRLLGKRDNDLESLSTKNQYEYTTIYECQLCSKRNGYYLIHD